MKTISVPGALSSFGRRVTVDDKPLTDEERQARANLRAIRNPIGSALRRRDRQLYGNLTLQQRADTSEFLLERGPAPADISPEELAALIGHRRDELLFEGKPLEHVEQWMEVRIEQVGRELGMQLASGYIEQQLAYATESLGATDTLLISALPNAVDELERFERAEFRRQDDLPTRRQFRRFRNTLPPTQ